MKEEQFTLEGLSYFERSDFAAGPQAFKWIARIYAIYGFGSPSSLIFEQSMTADQDQIHRPID
ncbi:MAG: hypothetical protein ACLROH_05875 [Streptococcus sp.]